MKCYLSKKQRRTAIALAEDSDLYISDSFMFDLLPGITKRVAAAINRRHDPVRAVAITADNFEDNDSLLELLKLAATAADRRCRDTQRVEIDAADSFRRAYKSLIDADGEGAVDDFDDDF